MIASYPRSTTRVLGSVISPPRRSAAPLPRRRVVLPRPASLRPRSRSRAGRRPGAPAGSSRPPRGRCPPARLPRLRETGSRLPIERTRPVGSGPGSAVKKRIASGCENCGSASSSPTSSPSAWRSAISTRSTPTAWRTRSAIWPPGMRAATSTTTTRPSGRGDELREGDAVPEPERAHRIDRDPLGSLELVGGDRRGVDVHPADPEADSRRAKPVGERQQRRLASASDDDPVHLDAVHERLDHRLVRRRLERALPRGLARDPSALSTRKTAALAARVDGLENRGKPGRARARARRPRVSEPRRTAVAGPRLRRARRASRACASSGARCRFRFPGARARPPRRPRPARRGRPRPSSTPSTRCSPADLGHRGEHR